MAAPAPMVRWVLGKEAWTGVEGWRVREGAMVGEQWREAACRGRGSLERSGKGSLEVQRRGWDLSPSASSRLAFFSSPNLKLKRRNDIDVHGPSNTVSNLTLSDLGRHRWALTAIGENDLIECKYVKMTTQPSKELPVADCEVVDDQIPTTRDVVQLAMFMEPLTAVQTIERTLRYARDPQEYLRSALGEDVFESKKSTLSMPDKVNFDTYGMGTHKQHFESHLARLLNKSHGLFFLTGVQAQLISLKIYAERCGRNKVAWHVSSHLESAEQKAYSHLYGLERVLLGNDPEALPTVSEIQSVLVLPEHERPAAILLEIPNRVLGCKTYSFSDLRQISIACRAANVALHCDGARLWEIEPFYKATAGSSFPELGDLFDSIYVSFYKALRGVTGAMLVHSDASFIADAKIWQRRAGGNAFTLGYEVIDCERGFNEMMGTFARKREKMMRIVKSITAATSSFRTEEGERVVSFIPEKANCSQIHTCFRGFTENELSAARDKVQARMNIRVFERLRPKMTLDEKLAEDRARVSERDKSSTLDVGVQRAQQHRTHFMEWMLMSVTEKIEIDVFVTGYKALCEELVSNDRN
nr:isoform c of uncharacterized protein [Quercus suber]